jgi:hypothetical protein
MRKKFRETLWFKKGVEAEAARAQAADAAPDADEEVTTVHELLPVEDRYLEDGSLRPSDSQLFGLHTGTTQAMQPIDIVRLMHAGGQDTGSAGVPERALIAEMKQGRRMVFAMIAVVMLALGGVAMTFV